MKNKSTRVILLILLLIIAGTSVLRAQNEGQKLRDAVNGATVTKDPKDTTKMTWKTGGLYNLTFNQAALSNWAAGGDKSAVSLSTLLSLYAYYQDGRRSWDNA